MIGIEFGELSRQIGARAYSASRRVGTPNSNTTTLLTGIAAARFYPPKKSLFWA